MILFPIHDFPVETNSLNSAIESNKATIKETLNIYKHNINLYIEHNIMKQGRLFFNFLIFSFF